MDGPIRYTKEPDAIAVIEMDDGKVNAIGDPLIEGLRSAFHRAREEKVRAVVLCGRVGCFSAGLDLKRLPAAEPQARAATIERFGRLMIDMLSFERPILALATGHAIAGGAVLLLCCDRRLAVRGPYQIGLREVAVGIPMPRAITELARAWIEPAKQLEAIALARLYPPATAADIGFVDEAIAPEGALERALLDANELGALPNPAFVRTRVDLREPIIASLERGVRIEFEHLCWETKGG